MRAFQNNYNYFVLLFILETASHDAQAGLGLAGLKHVIFLSPPPQWLRQQVYCLCLFEALFGFLWK